MRSILTIHNTNSECMEEVYGPAIATHSADFRWADYLQAGGFQWGSQNWVGFTAGTGGDPGSDCPVFRVVRSENVFDAIAKTHIRYYGTRF